MVRRRLLAAINDYRRPLSWGQPKYRSRAGFPPRFLSASPVLLGEASVWISTVSENRGADAGSPQPPAAAGRATPPPEAPPCADTSSPRRPAWPVPPRQPVLRLPAHWPGSRYTESQAAELGFGLANFLQSFSPPTR